MLFLVIGYDTGGTLRIWFYAAGSSFLVGLFFGSEWSGSRVHGMKENVWS